MNATKAILAAVLAGIASFVATAEGAEKFTTLDWVMSVLSAVVVGGGVYLVPNKPNGA